MANERHWSFERGLALDPAVTTYLVELHRRILGGFSLEDFKQLCFETGIAYDDLPGDGRRAKARELLQYCVNRGLLEHLDQKLRQKRSNIEWPLLTEPVRFGALSPTGKLADMPANMIPEVGVMPPGSRMVLNRNPLFTGRETDLMNLARTLKGGETVAVGQVAATTGMGGIGKTQLAVEFVYRYGRYFAGGVYWLSFAEPEGISAEFTQCGLAMGLFDEVADTENQAEMVKITWADLIPRLLVFDNLDTRNAEQLLAMWRPKGGGARLLVTSRRRSWNPGLGVSELELGLLSREQSIKLLRRFRQDLAEDAANEIAEELGDLPLALHLAGSFLAYYEGDVTTEDYLAEWRDDRLDHESMAGEWLDFAPTDREMHLFNTFMMSYRRLQPENQIDKLAIDLAARASQFAPGEAIPWDLLRATIRPSSDGEEEDPREQRRLTQARKRLERLGLLETVQEKDAEQGIWVRMHRLIVAFVHGAAEKEGTAGEALADVEEAVIDAADLINEAGYPRPLLAWQGHLRYLTDRALEREDERATILSNELGFHLDMIGEYHAARPYFERSLAIREETLGADHPDTALSLNNLGALLRAMGDYEAARTYYERALAIDEEALGLENPDTASDLNNLGALLMNMGDYEAARSYLERSLTIREQVLDSDHRDTAQSLNDLGLLLEAMGDYETARPHFERALAIYEETMGPYHPFTATTLDNLGGLLDSMEDFEQARYYYMRALDIREEVLGSNHPDTATSLNNLGSLYYSMGGYQLAYDYYERALEIFENVLGPEHPDTARGLNNLGGILDSIGNYEDARPYYERALAINEKVLGPDHPDTADSLNSLGALFDAMGDPDAARAYFERALAINEKALGPDHPTTQIVRVNLESLDWE